MSCGASREPCSRCGSSLWALSVFASDWFEGSESGGAPALTLLQTSTVDLLIADQMVPMGALLPTLGTEAMSEFTADLTLQELLQLQCLLEKMLPAPLV